MNPMMMTTMTAEGGGGGAFPPQPSQAAAAGAALAQPPPPPGVLTVNQNIISCNNTEKKKSNNFHPRACGSSIGLTADFKKSTTTTTTTSKAVCTSTSSCLSLAHPQMKWSTNDFTVGRPLGRGKFGNVYMAKENRTSKPVALKVIFKNTLTSSKSYNLLRREVEIQIRCAFFKSPSLSSIPFPLYSHPRTTHSQSITNLPFLPSLPPSLPPQGCAIQTFFDCTGISTMPKAAT